MLPTIGRNLENSLTVKDTQCLKEAVMKQSDRFRENAENCAHLAEQAADRPTCHRYQRMEAAWRALAHEQDWLDGEIAPTRKLNGTALNITEHV